MLKSALMSIETPTATVHPWPVYGHQWAVQLLQRAVASAGRRGAHDGAPNGPHHAYLFTGPAQVGKTTLARAFAQALLCERPEAAPCGECRACRLVQAGSHPDFRLIQPTKKAKEKDKELVVDRVDGELRRDQVAEIIADAATRPAVGRFKFFLVQDFHAANATFANRLLKTLEEPPAHVVLCLTATGRSALLPTIVSRCQVVELRPVDRATICRALEQGWGAQPAEADLLARLANGRLGWAVRQLQDGKGTNKRKEDLEALWSLVSAGRIERLAFAERLAKNADSRALFGLVELWTGWWRDVLLTQQGLAGPVNNTDKKEEIAIHAQGLDPQTVRAYLDTLQRIEGYLHHTVNTRAALDVLLLRLPRAARPL